MAWLINELDRVVGIKRLSACLQICRYRHICSERSLRAPVIGRKLSFGNDSWTGARLTAHIYSVLATLKRHGIDLEHWLHEWLSACAAAGRAPSDLTPWLPWSMDPARRKRLQQPRASPVHG